MSPKDEDENIVDPNQTATSGSTLFTQTCLSENLGPLKYLVVSSLVFFWPLWED